MPREDRIILKKKFQKRALVSRAFDETGQIVEASVGKKGNPYFCIDCGSVLRVRKGRQTRAHFYHLRLQASCSRHGKSEAHHQIQLNIAKQLPSSEGVLEKRFPSIQRIADLCWENKKIIFEIQCSPISQEEIEKRNFDYGKEGYKVVWIFHEKLFQTRRKPLLWPFIQTLTHYFTSIDCFGSGVIYDPLFKGRGKVKESAFIPDFTVPLVPPKKSSLLPFPLKMRGCTWKLHFKNDCLDKLSEKKRILLFLYLKAQQHLRNFCHLWIEEMLKNSTKR